MGLLLKRSERSRSPHASWIAQDNPLLSPDFIASHWPYKSWEYPSADRNGGLGADSVETLGTSFQARIRLTRTML